MTTSQTHSSGRKSEVVEVIAALIMLGAFIILGIFGMILLIPAAPFGRRRITLGVVLLTLASVLAVGAVVLLARRCCRVTIINGSDLSAPLHKLPPIERSDQTVAHRHV